MEVAQNNQIAVVGALAYDQISTTDIPLTGQDTPLLNRKLLSMQESFGGCGANIAYNLAALGSRALLATCTGAADDQRFLEHCRSRGIDSSAFLRAADCHCARAIIITDPNGKQFTGFYPGFVPTGEAWRAHLASLDLSSVAVLVQAPYPVELMLTSLQHAAALPRPPLAIWCPGQYADQLTARQIGELLEHAHWVVGNAHELDYLGAAALRGKLAIRTNSEEPVQVTFPDGTQTSFPVPAAPAVVDPTGCGDAFIAALAHHIAAHPPAAWMDELPGAIAAGNASAAACLAMRGGQSHEL